MSSKVTLSTLHKMKQSGVRFSCLTAYDATFAKVLDSAGVEVILVGDSLGMVIQGQESTVAVDMDDMVYHTKCVQRGARNALIMADMPFMSYPNPDEALYNAARLMREGGAHMVKLEGGARIVETVRALAENGVPVCAHLGLLPQSVHKLGGYKVQGREEAQAEQMLLDAEALVEAGADILLLECVPSELALRLTKSVDVPVIGIGAGAGCDAQVLVLHDMLGLGSGVSPKFVKDFLAESGSIGAAIESYVAAVKSGEFPAEEHSFE
ncbi:MAG: 3-methyl-2-oxobutanoate hydroxymethyltransferase [Gammaproteobacteria bacterium]|nr:3-methyl-2-oxobutanoate hydroxymethyltransferase [Gammaproteobacteria bacterium]